MRLQYSNTAVRTFERTNPEDDNGNVPVYLRLAYSQINQVRELVISTNTYR